MAFPRASESSPSQTLDLVEAINVFIPELTVGSHNEYGVAMAVDVVVVGSQRPLHPAICGEISRIAHEAIRNAIQHARASRIEAEITYDANCLRIRVRDDGIGIDPKVLECGSRAGHWGLLGMKERSERLGGRLEVWSKPGAGTEVEIRVAGDIAYRSKRAGFLWFRRKAKREYDSES